MHEKYYKKKKTTHTQSGKGETQNITCKNIEHST